MAIIVCPLIYLLLFFAFPGLRVVLLLYGVYCYMDPSVESGMGNQVEWIRSLSVWDYIVSYFTPRIVCEERIDPKRKHIACVHPHGILSYGAQLVLGAKKSGLDDAVPGLKLHPAVLPVTLRVPIFREYLRSLGSISSSKESIRRCLARGDGHVPGIVVGGARESLMTSTEVTSLLLRNRKGFVREALVAGADLLPIFVFNENKIFKQVDNPPGSLLFMVQMRLKKFMHFAIPIFYGKNGCIPFRTPITFVLGKPVELEKIECPTEDDIDRYHALYLESLANLWARHHAKYDGEAKKLEII
ncbi:diacylglycerol acyltransferase [Martensiomyces pterosporus]|nr:diacylglycerol acyltransferase [Martensiomyces pterosporus]